jgi:hypothetical protein
LQGFMKGQIAIFATAPGDKSMGWLSRKSHGCKPHPMILL